VSFNAVTSTSQSGSTIIRLSGPVAKYAAVVAALSRSNRLAIEADPTDAAAQPRGALGIDPEV